MAKTTKTTKAKAVKKVVTVKAVKLAADEQKFLDKYRAFKRAIEAEREREFSDPYDLQVEIEDMLSDVRYGN